MSKPVVQITTLEDSPPWIDRRLVDAYLRTTYRAPEPGLELRVGVRNPALQAWLEQWDAPNFAVLTAWNPRSEPLSTIENAARNARLEIDLRRAARIVLPALGIGDRGDWPPEDSFFAAGLAPDTAAALGLEFGQNALVFGEKGRAPVLWWLQIPPAVQAPPP